MTLIYFILVLGITVLIHEFGHYLFAKRAGIYCYEFSIGMGPRLFKWHRKNDETEYSIRLFPIGGYVSMAGESVEVDKNVPKNKHLQYKTWGQRFSVMIAGVLFNYILAVVCFFIVGLVSGSQSGTPYISTVVEGYPAQEVGLEAGSKITAINGKKIDSLDRLSLELAVYNGKEIDLTILTPESETKEYHLVPKKEEVDGTETYKYGFTIESPVEKGFFSALKYGFTKFFSLVEQMLLIIWYLCTGKLSLGSLSGPVGIYNIVGESAKAGMINLVYLVGYLCVNVGILNIIPLPAFDGGHVLFLIIEKIKGKPVSPKVENTIHSIGFIFLMILMIAITINDIIRLFG